MLFVSGLDNHAEQRVQRMHGLGHVACAILTWQVAEAGDDRRAAGVDGEGVRVRWPVGTGVRRHPVGGGVAIGCRGGCVAAAERRSGGVVHGDLPAVAQQRGVCAAEQPDLGGGAPGATIRESPSAARSELACAQSPPA